MYGNRIKTIRTDLKLTQKEFASKLGTTQKCISKYELERLDLSTEIIVKICNTFDVTADYLLGLTDY